jgi:putative oxidoreductase
MKLGALALRTTIGGLFVGHGTQKLFGWFDGPGLDGVSGMMEKLELRPPRRHALLAGLSETVGGALLTAGAFTPVATAMLTGSMTTAIRKVHAPKGVWVTGGGYEYNAVLIAALAALVDSGPGALSVDSAVFPRMRGPVWAAAAVAAGVAGSYLAERPPFNEPASGQAGPDTRTGRFERVEQPVETTA